MRELRTLGYTMVAGGTLCTALLILTRHTAAQTPLPLTTLYSFKGGSDGANPGAGVIVGMNGTLYGTTLAGGIRDLAQYFP